MRATPRSRLMRNLLSAPWVYPAPKPVGMFAALLHCGPKHCRPYPANVESLQSRLFRCCRGRVELLLLPSHNSPGDGNSCLDQAEHQTFPVASGCTRDCKASVLGQSAHLLG